MSTPHSSQKRVSIIFPADGCVRNFLGFGATYRILFIALVTCLPTYRTLVRYFEFLSQFYGFHLTHVSMQRKLSICCCLITRTQGKIMDIKTANRSFENVELFRYLWNDSYESTFDKKSKKVNLSL
jgi:hypothetical protein